MNLVKISQKLWEIVGLLVAILFLLGILAVFVGVGFGAYQLRAHQVNGVAVNPEGDKGKLKTTVEYGLPLPFEESDFFMIPVKLEKKKQGQEREAVYSKAASKSYGYDGRVSSYGDASYGGPLYNIVFINKQTGESRPLLSQKGFIDGVYFPETKYGKKEEKIKPTFLLLEIATADTNHDGVINEKDASAGFIASVDGIKLTQVTPDNTRMRQWRYDADSKKLFLEIVRDANRDQRFNWDDPQTVVSVDVFDPQMGQEFIPEKVKGNIESVLLEK